MQSAKLQHSVAANTNYPFCQQPFNQTTPQPSNLCMNDIKSPKEHKEQKHQKVEENTSQPEAKIKVQESKMIKAGSQVSQIGVKSDPKDSEIGIQIHFVLNKSKISRNNAQNSQSSLGRKLQLQSQPIETNAQKIVQTCYPPVLKPKVSQVVEPVQLLNLRQAQVKISTGRTYKVPGQNQQTSIRLQNESIQVKPQNASQVRPRVQSQSKFSQSKSVYNPKMNPYVEKEVNINHISPLPLKYQKNFQERSQIQKLISGPNSERNPIPYEFNLSENMERSEVQHFQGNKLVNINQQRPNQQLPTLLLSVREIEGHLGEQKPTERTEKAETQNFDIKHYLQDSDWLAHMGEIDQAKEVKYILAFMFQLVFIYFSLHFATKTPKGQCMDSSHGLDFFVLRPWMLGSVFADVLVTLSMLVVIILHVAKVIQPQKFQILERVGGLVWVGKMFTWNLALTALMLQSLRGFCSAGILTYGIGSIVIQTIIMVVLLVRKCQQPDSSQTES